MLLTVLRNKKGVTLVEVLISLVILLVVFMGLLQASLLSVETNVTNVLRDEAVRLASDTMIALQTSPFDDLDRDNAPDAVPPPNPFLTMNSAGTAPLKVAAQRLGINTVRTSRNITSNFFVTVTIGMFPGDNNNKQATVLVEWDWKERTRTNGNANSYRVTALLRRT
jgi:prepilin-type N-terminal cleavage/methylation domain-containing protein